MPEQPPVTPGTMLVSVTLSPVVGGILQTSAPGDQRLWHVDDPEKLRSHLGRGLLARTPAGEGRYREVGFLDAHQGVLILPARFPAEQGGVSAVDIVNLTPVQGNGVVNLDQSREDIAQAIRLSLDLLVEEGGAVVLEPSVPDGGGTRWVRLIRRPEHVGVWTAPAPPPSEIWDPRFVDDNVSKMLLGLDEVGLHNAAVLASIGFLSWEGSPWDVRLTFVPAPTDQQPPPSSKEETKPPKRGLFRRRRRSESGESASEVALDHVSKARSSISAAQGVVRIEPLGGAHWSEARIGLGPWAARVIVDAERAELRFESQIPGVVDTSLVDEAVSTALAVPPETRHESGPGPHVVTLSYCRPLVEVDPAVVQQTAMMLAVATSVTAQRVWHVLSPFDVVRLASLGIAAPDQVPTTPQQMLMSEPIANVEWDARLTPVDASPPAKAALPDGVVGEILGPLGPEWDSTIQEVREVLEQFASTMSVEVQRHSRDDEIYVQVSNEGEHFFAEAVSNTFLEGASRLDSKAMQRLSHLGWHAPTEDSPNWHRTYDDGDTQDVADHIARTLRDGYGADPTLDGWMITWSESDARRTASPAVNAVPPLKTRGLAPVIADALTHVRNALGTDFKTRERADGGFDLVTRNGQPYGVAEGDAIRLRLNSAARMRYAKGWGSTVVNSTTNEKEWVVRAGEFDVDRGDLGRLVGMVAGAKRRLGPERPTDKAPPESTGSGLASTGSPLSVGVPEITEMLRSALQSGTGTHLDVGTGYVRWQGDPEQGIFAEASNGRPGEEPIDNGLADALVSVGWSRPRPKEGIEVCWVELMLGADEPSHRFDARLEAVAEVILNGMTALLERD